MPSYPQPSAASYYAAVSGANLLHSEGVTGRGVNVAVLSVGRGNGKSSLSAMLCVGELVGAWSDAAEREVIIADFGVATANKDRDLLSVSG